MKVAVDVMGTLKGPKRAQVVAIVQVLLSAGHSVDIWSSESSIAMNACRLLKEDLTALGFPVDNLDWMTKREKWQLIPEAHYDYAIEDDRRQTYLAAKNFIWVDELPAELMGCVALVGGLK